VALRETEKATAIDIDGRNLPVRPAGEIRLEKVGSQWIVQTDQDKRLRKKYGLQGPIDDAFLDAFLCVRPSGVPWNDEVNRQALNILARFERLYAKYFRARLRIKDDKDVTGDDIAKYNLALFGDPGSNRLISRIHGKLPIRWTRQAVAFGGGEFSAAGHLPAMIYPNPLNSSRYVVLNSGLTAEERDYRGDFLLPRLGDFAVLIAGGGMDVPEIASAGMFDEFWQLPKQ
jgi:hypothetical protein